MGDNFNERNETKLRSSGSQKIQERGTAAQPQLFTAAAGQPVFRLRRCPFQHCSRNLGLSRNRLHDDDESDELDFDGSFRSGNAAVRSLY